MRIRCEHDSIDDVQVSAALAARLRRLIRLPRLPLTVGREYIVYATLSDQDATWYFILEEDRDDYPKCYAAPFFSVIDARPSRLWVEREHATGTLRAIPAWGNSKLFYERLVDGEPAEVAAFSAARAQMDLDYELPEVSLLAEALEDGWVLCPACGDASQSDPSAALLRCSNSECGKLLRNPLGRSD